jgi:2-keto-4-pentenoate hydratase
MVMNDLDSLEQLSEALLQARQTRTPMPPLTDTRPGLTVPDAYAIAQLGVAVDLGQGARVIGHKIGLTAAAVQRQLGVDTPDYGVLLDTMSVADGALIDAGDYIAPRIEVELAFRLGADLPPRDVTSADVRAATAAVHPAFELVDSRIADWRITLVDTVADRGSSAAFVIGDAARSLHELDVTAVEVTLERDGEAVRSGRSDAVLGDPCEAVAWLANAVGALGEPLRAGELALSGAIAPILDAALDGRHRPVERRSGPRPRGGPAGHRRRRRLAAGPARAPRPRLRGDQRRRPRH